ncbi:cell envelope integrity protein CreD [bacterium]|nr:cell envelope integrity protein CreD [bacterium]
MNSNGTGSFLNGIGGFFDSIRKSPFIRILLVGFLILLLQIPIFMIDRVIGDRRMRKHEATRDITSKWGEQQTIIGPLLTVPYFVEITEKDKDGDILVRREMRHADFLPNQLQITGTAKSEIRYRGIYKVPIYSLDLNVNGEFSRPDFSAWGIETNQVLWDRAHLTVRISDSRAITEQVSLTWSDTSIPFLPGVGEYGGGHAGIHADLEGQLDREKMAFAFPLKLNGSQGLFFAPFGRDTTVQLKSNWHAPSFQGNWLPTKRILNEAGFNAAWNIPFLGRGYAQQWRSQTNNASNIERQIASSLFGVRFITPVDQYRMAQRSIKYAILFLVLTFVALWLFEVLLHVRVHPIQYLFVGVGMCLFYLLELSLAEHIGFVASYILASLAVILLISSYCVAVLKGTRRAAVMAGVTTLLYGYLYLLLMNQDYSLLIGSLGLFLILAAIMYLTRKIDWFSMKM